MNKKINKLVSLGLTGVMALSMAACGGEGGANPPAAGNEGNSGDSGNGGAAAVAANTEYTTDTHRDLVIGSWWRMYYASGDVMEDSPDWVTAQFADDDSDALREEKTFNQDLAVRKMDTVKKIEEKYNCSFTWTNLTYDGTAESLQTSTLAGTPDADVYMVATSMAVPAQANGLLLDLHTVLPADHDLFTDQKYMTYLDMGDGKASILWYQGGFKNTYPLAFNVQMLEEEGLEDPRDLYARGEWTWDKFREYCEALTQDTDGDGQTDQYGFCGFANDTFNQLLMSNGAAVAGGTTETLSSAATGECLQFLSDMYNTWKVCYPYEYFKDGANPSDSMRIQYNNGNIAFFPIAVWIQNANGNYPNGEQGNLTWDTAYVQWPVGPSGNQDTNATINSVDGNWFVIPVNVEQPALVANFLYDLNSWWEGMDENPMNDRKANNWWYNETAKVPELNDANFEVQQYCLAHPGMELWESLNVEGLSLEDIIDGTMTPAQFQETYKQPVQDALDAMFK
ncbi:MAG: extracellular solute-binding protein [Lachnospiraceae bacterium]|nr:extracellular solute-binding protein [Lachnospiraceae bacterium]